MEKYIDKDEALICRLGGEFTPISKKAPLSLELTDKRIYYCAASVLSAEKKTAKFTASVIDVADVSSFTYSYEIPKGKWGLGILLFFVSLIAGVILGILPLFQGEQFADILYGASIKAGIGLGVGLFLMILYHAVSYVLSRKSKSVLISIEYRGMILSAIFSGLNDETLISFRNELFRTKDMILDRKVSVCPSLKEAVSAEKPLSNTYSDNESIYGAERADFAPIERDLKKKPKIKQKKISGEPAIDEF